MTDTLRQLRWLVRALVVTITVVAVWPDTAGAQFYFGKNKVQYTKFDWQVMTTDHFHLYFYTSESDITGIAAGLAEDSYRELSARFNHEVIDKIPLIIYSSPAYFSQTNVIPGLLPESVAGFTEFMKGRVVVPFHGSYHDFDHVIRHELVHVFMLSKLESVLKKHRFVRYMSPPLWFTEGLAEYWSKQWDPETDMIVGDAVIGGRLPSIDQMYQIRGSYLMYKLGESLCHFIDSTYGSDKLVRMLENWHKGRSFAHIVRITLGDDLKKLSQRWHYFLRKRYYPKLRGQGLPTMESHQVTSGGFSVSGVPIDFDDGDGRRQWLIFTANRLGYTGIYMMPADGEGHRAKVLLKGERSTDFESLHLMRSGIDANDSGLIVFSAKSREKDVIYIYELDERRVTCVYEFDDLVAARSPRFSPDGTGVVFSGVGIDGFSNLYLLDLVTGDYRPLTDDIYHDVSPAFSPDGRQVVFASDRGADGYRGALNLFTINIATGRLTQLTFGAGRDDSPCWTDRGVFFSSDREGTFNLYLLDDNGTLIRQSSYVTGVLQPRLSPDGERLYYTGFQNMAFQIFQMELPAEAPVVASTPPEVVSNWQPRRLESKYEHSSVRYNTRYSLDIAQSSVGYDPVYGSLGGLQVMASDMLGNHAFHFLLTNTAGTKDKLMESFNFGVTYINLERRINWGVGAFHLFDEYYNDYDVFYTERQAGLLSLVRYPLSKFRRLDLVSLAKYSKRTRTIRSHGREAFLLTNYLSWVFDNSLWEITGPIEGRRYNITIGTTVRMDQLRSFSRLAMADVRHYLRLGRHSALANRLFAYSSSGIEPQRIYFGGSWSFRGYSRREFYNRNILFTSNELRFPLMDNLVLGFPFGTMAFSQIRGALFFDAGAGWDDVLDRFRGSFGAGFRVALGYLVILRFDFSRTTNFKTISSQTDFDFFFGWNF